MARGQSSDTPGLKWRPRHNGPPTPYWLAPDAAIKAGFTPKSWNLSKQPPEDVPAICQRAQAAALAFVSKHQYDRPGYDGTIGSLIELYQTHPESPFKRLKATSLNSYSHYAAKIDKNYGARRIASLTGLDIMRWHETWRKAPDGTPRYLAAAAMALSILKAALGFGQVCGFKDCMQLRGMISTPPLSRARARGSPLSASSRLGAVPSGFSRGHHRRRLRLR